MKKSMVVVAVILVLAATLAWGQETKKEADLPQLQQQLQQLAVDFQVQLKLKEDAVRSLVEAQQRIDALQQEYTRLQAEIQKVQKPAEPPKK